MNHAQNQDLKLARQQPNVILARENQPESRREDEMTVADDPIAIAKNAAVIRGRAVSPVAEKDAHPKRDLAGGKNLAPMSPVRMNLAPAIPVSRVPRTRVPHARASHVAVIVPSAQVLPMGSSTGMQHRTMSIRAIQNL
jgi:hypothetical protein